MYKIQDGKKLLQGFSVGKEPTRLANISLYDDEVGAGMKSSKAIMAYSRSPENASVLMPKACGIIQVSKVSKKAFVHSSTGHVVTVSQDGPWESPSQGILIS